MLLYERGDFFVPHQDSEKDDGMIGTLVVTLPSSFRGGEMTVEQHGEIMAFRGSRTALQLIAFYADCRHEVRPVTSGARVVLTYNLLTAGVARAMPARIEPPARDALTSTLQRPPSVARRVRPGQPGAAHRDLPPHARRDVGVSRSA
jgi:hypothetical protein